MRRNLYEHRKRVIITEVKKAKQMKICDAKLKGLKMFSMAASCSSNEFKLPCRFKTGYSFEHRGNDKIYVQKQADSNCLFYKSYCTKSSHCRVLKNNRQMHTGAGRVVHRFHICEMAKPTLNQGVA